MPPHIKIVLSLLVFAAALAGHLGREAIGLQASAGFLAGLALFMVVALWIFPEPRSEKPPRK